MDLYALMVVRTNSWTKSVERYKFHNIFRKFYGKDSSLEIRIIFDILGDKSILPISVLNILYAQIFTPQISEAEAEEESIFELCSIAACIRAEKIDALHYFGKGLTGRAMSITCWKKVLFVPCIICNMNLFVSW